MSNSSWFFLMIPFVALLVAVSVHIGGGMVDFYGDSTHTAQRGGVNFLSGTGISLSASDDPTNNRVNVTVRTGADSGAATIASGATSVAVSHTLGSSAARVQLTPSTDTLGARFWVSNITSTQFTINLHASQASDIDFHWRAQSEE